MAQTRTGGLTVHPLPGEKYGLFYGLSSPSGVKRLASGVILDQGQHSCCVGCGCVDVLNAEPNSRNLTLDDALSIYADAQAIDGLGAGEPARQGTTIEAGAKILSKRGLITDWRWTDNAEEAWEYFWTVGPLITGLTWTNDMEDSTGILSPSGWDVGGHCTAIIAADATQQLPMLLVQNSWGVGWGHQGCAWITLDDLQKLFNKGGSAIALAK
jgi:hypothetical protein